MISIHCNYDCIFCHFRPNQSLLNSNESDHIFEDGPTTSSGTEQLNTFNFICPFFN